MININDNLNMNFSTKEECSEDFKKNYNNPFTRLNHNCDKPYGEINYYYVDSSSLNGYSMLNFDKGKDLIEIGYNDMKTNKYKLC